MRCLIAVAAALLCSTVAFADEGAFKVAYMGTNAGTVLETPSGKVYVIDPAAASARDHITPYLRSLALGGRGTAVIDGIIVTHPHGDHYKGIPYLLQQFRVKRVYESGYRKYATASWEKTIVPLLAAAGVARTSDVRAGQTLELDSALEVKVLGPQHPFVDVGSTENRITNENSIVLWIRHGRVSFLFMGDAPDAAQARIAQLYPRETAATSVLYLPHHGRRYFASSFANLVGTERPGARVAFASSTALDTTLVKWRAAGLTVHEGRLTGRVTATSTGRGFLLRTERTGVRRLYRVAGRRDLLQPFLAATASGALSVAHAASQQVATRFSLAAWVRAERDAPRGTIAAKGSNWGAWVGADGRIDAGFRDRAGVWHRVASRERFDDDAWHHVAVTFADERLELWVDGQSRASERTAALPDARTTEPVVVGAALRGDVDEVLLWSRALSASDVAALAEIGLLDARGLLLQLDMGWRTFDGAAAVTVRPSRALALEQFRVTVRFRASMAPSKRAMLVGKGGMGSDAPGENLNYGLWLMPDGTLGGGFEAADGADEAVGSTGSTLDGRWHVAVIAYDGARLRLSLDGQVVAQRAATARPDIAGSRPLTIGADARTGVRAFRGAIDDVQVVNLASGTIVYAAGFHE